jgi:hypothetical protein
MFSSLMPALRDVLVRRISWSMIPNRRSAKQKVADFSDKIMLEKQS